MNALTHEQIEEIGHSPLGMSAMHRIAECPGSVGLSYGVDDQEDDTYSLPGTAAHKLGELCLHNSVDAWTFIGKWYDPVMDCFGLAPTYGQAEPQVSTEGLVKVDKEMADAVQIYLDAVRVAHPDRNQGNTWIEYKFYCPSIHKYFWGTSDLVHAEHDLDTTLHIWDFKYGAGIMVDVRENPQLMGYAVGVIEKLKLWANVGRVELHLCQPRGYLELHRTWGCGIDDLADWRDSFLIPNLKNAMVSRDTASGEHCRFCPTRYRACPQIVKDMKELEKMITELEGKTADHLTNEQLSRLLHLVDVAKIAGKAGEQTAFRRLNSGKAVPGFKLVPKKANREFKEGAEAAAKKEFGDSAYTKPELKSPAQIEALPKGEAFCARWAFKPDNGLTLARGEDQRTAVNKDTKSLFAPVKKRGKAA